MKGNTSYAIIYYVNLLIKSKFQTNIDFLNKLDFELFFINFMKIIKIRILYVLA